MPRTKVLVLHFLKTAHTPFFRCLAWSQRRGWMEKKWRLNESPTYITSSVQCDILQGIVIIDEWSESFKNLGFSKGQAFFRWFTSDKFYHLASVYCKGLLSITSSQFQTQAREEEWRRLRSIWETSPTTRENGKFVLGIKCHTWSQFWWCVGKDNKYFLGPNDIQGGFIDWSAPKMTKCQSLRKFWHLELV